MSSNKLKYWEVTTTQVVKANTKSEAVALATSRSRKGSPSFGSILTSEVTAERISAAEAHGLVSQTS